MNVLPNIFVDNIREKAQFKYDSWILQIMQMNNKMSREFFVNHVFGLFFISLDQNPVPVRTFPDRTGLPRTFTSC